MSFSDIINQNNALDILKQELKSNEISHAYLFSGKNGVGKKTLALEFVKTLFCDQKEIDNCGNCISCKKIKHHNHPDVKLIKIEEDSKQLKIEQIREIQKEISYRPYENEWKVYIIEEADKMTLQAANSLLKTLEEPPSYAIIILITEEINNLLPTIVSRCELIKLNNIPRGKIKNYLLGEGIDESEARLYSLLAQGSLGDALDLTDNKGFFKKREAILDFLAKLPEQTRVKIFDKVREMEEIISGGFPFFNLILSWYRDIILCMKEAQGEVMNLDYIEEIKNQSHKYNIEEVISIIEMINKYENYIEKNCQKKLTLQVLLLNIRSKRV